MHQEPISPHARRDILLGDVSDEGYPMQEMPAQERQNTVVFCIIVAHGKVKLLWYPSG